jgi:hypothetical protein
MPSEFEFQFARCLLFRHIINSSFSLGINDSHALHCCCLFVRMNNQSNPRMMIPSSSSRSSMSVIQTSSSSQQHSGKQSTNRAPPHDPNTINTWIYPTNYPVRQYQFDICNKALFANTLVCLPTGLGKTLIAAVVMYNYYRWFPTGKLTRV